EPVTGSGIDFEHLDAPTGRYAFQLKSGNNPIILEPKSEPGILVKRRHATLSLRTRGHRRPRRFRREPGLAGNRRGSPPRTLGWRRPKDRWARRSPRRRNRRRSGPPPA